MPYWQEIRYQGADISGDWLATYKDDEKFTEASLSLVLTQSAHNIHGSMHYSMRTTDKKQSLDFDVVGEYWETYLALTAKSKNRRTFSGGVLYLKSVRNGRELEGNFSFRDSRDDKVVNHYAKFVRT
ncbi:hypothetical protein FORC53_1316 [Vibrio vulnificus]|uniref:Uncharacterized protein n=1 Tax=Vibrio vulnificus TaxID=672 RepID=A0AAN1PND3_VIBVL|nr:hypothetical protein FORC53_1316 [Vibrio vulnificus]